MKKYMIIEPGLTYLKKFQIITETKLIKAKKDFGFNPNFLSTDEKNQTFTFTDDAEKLSGWYEFKSEKLHNN